MIIEVNQYMITDIPYPQDLNLLNSAREKLEAYIDCLHEGNGAKKPRTYREIARKEFLNVSKARKKSSKKIRKAIRKQLNYIQRDIGYIECFRADGKPLLLSNYQSMQLYNQEKTMFDSGNCQVS